MNSKKTDDKLSGRRQPTVPQKKLERNSTILNIYPQNVQRTTAIKINEAEKPNDLSKKTVRRTHRKESPHRPVAVTKTKENVQNSDFESFFNSAMTLCEKLLIKQECYFDDDEAELKENEAPSKVPPPTDFTTKEQLPIRCSSRLAHKNLRHEQGQNRKNLRPNRSSNEFEDCEIKRELIEFSEQENCLDYNEIPSKMPPTFSTMELSVKESPADGFTTKQLPLKEPILCLTRLEDTNLWPQQEWSHKELKTNDDRNQSSNEFEDIYNIETEPTQLSESLTMKQNRKNCKTALKKTRSSNDFEDDCNIKTGVSQRDLQQSTSTVPSEIETANLTTISSHSGNQEQSGLGDPPGVIEYEVLIKAEPEDSNDEAASTAHSSGHEDSEAVTGYIFLKVPAEGDTDGRPTMCWVEPTGNLSLNEIEKMAENLFNTEVDGVSFANWSDEHITDSAFSINRLEDASIASGPVLELQIEHLTNSAPFINGLEDASIASGPVLELQIEHLTNSAPSINGLEDASIASDPVPELQIEHLTNSAPSINGLEDASIATSSAVKSAASAIQVDETESKEDIIHGEIWELMEDLGFVEEDIKMEDDVEDLFSVLDCGGTDTDKTVEELDIITGEDIKMEDDVEDLFSGLDCDDIDTAETVEEQDIITGEDIKMEDDVEDLFSGLDCDDIDAGETVEEVDIEMKDIEMEDDKDLFSLWDYADIDTGESVEEQEIKITFSPLPEQPSETEQNRHLLVSPGYGIQEEQEIATFERSRGQRVKELQDEQQPGFTSTPVQTVARRSRSRLRSSRRAKSAAKKRALSDSSENYERKVVKVNKASMPGSESKLTGKPLNISEGRASQSLTKNKAPRYITRSRSRCSEQSYQPVEKEVDVFLSSVSESRVAQSLAEDEAPRYCITRSKSRCSKEAEQSMAVEENSKEVDLSISEGRVARSLTKDEARRHIIERKSRSREKAHYSLAVEEDDEEVKELLSGISTDKMAQLLVKDETSRYVTRSKSRCSEETYQPFVVEEDDKEVEILLRGISKGRVAQPLFEDEAPHYYVTRSKSRCSKEAEQPMVAEESSKELDRRRHITKRKSRSGEKAHHSLAVEEDDEEVKELLSGISKGKVARSLAKDETLHYINRSKSRCSEQTYQGVVEEEDDKEVEILLSGISKDRMAQSLFEDEAAHYYITRSKSRCSKEAEQPIVAEESSKELDRRCHITKRKPRSGEKAHHPLAVEEDDEEVKELMSGICEGRVAQSLNKDEAPHNYVTRSKSRCSKEAEPPILAKENSKDAGKPLSISEHRVARSLTKHEAPRHITKRKSRNRNRGHQPLAVGKDDKEVKELLSGFSEGRVAQSLDEDKAPRYHITRSRSRCSKEAQPPIATKENSKDVGKPSSISEGRMAGSLTKDETRRHIESKSRSRDEAHQSLAGEEADKEVEELLSSFSASRVGQSLDKDEAPRYYITRSKSRCSKEAEQPIAAQDNSKVVEKPVKIFEDEASCHITKRKSRSRKGAHQPVATEDVDEEIRILLDGISESRLAHSLEDEASHCYITRSKSRCREEAQQLVTPQGSDKAENVLTGISEGRVARSLTKDVAPRYITRSKSRCRAEAQQPIASEESARDVRLLRLGKVKNLQEDLKYFSDDTDVKKRLFYKVFIDEYYKLIELKKRILNNFSNKHSKSANKENTTNLLKDGLFSCLSDNTAIIGKDLTSQPEALNKILRNELPIVSTAKATVSENTKLKVTEIDKTSTISVTNQGGSKKPVMGEPRDLLKCNMCVDQTAVQSNLEDHKAFVHYGKPLVLKQNATEIRNKSTSLQNWGTYTTSCNHNKIKKQLMYVQSDNKRHFEVGEAFSKCSICHQSQDSSQLLKFNGMNVKGATNSTYAPDVCPLKIPNSKTCTETNFMKDEDTAQTKFKDSLLIQCNNEVNSTGARNFQNLRVDDTFENKYQGKRAIGKFNSFHKQKPYSKQGSSENELTGSLLVRSRTETTSTSATYIQNIQNLSCRPCSDQNIEEKNNESVSFIKSRDSPEKKTRTTATGLKESIKNRLKVYTLTKEQLYGTPGMLKEVILKDFDKTSNSPPKHIRPTYCKTENLETKAFHKEKIHITNAARSLQVPKTNVTGQSERSTERISKTTLGETANVSQPAKRSLDCASQPALDHGINAGFVQASKAASARYNSALQRRGTFKRSFSASEIDNLKMVGGNNNFYSRILTKADYTKNAKATGECEMQVEIEKMYCIKQALKCIQLDHSYAQDTSGPYQILEPLFFGCNQCSFSAVLANSLQDHMITFHNKVYQAL